MHHKTRKFSNWTFVYLFKYKSQWGRNDNWPLSNIQWIFNSKPNAEQYQFVSTQKRLYDDHGCQQRRNWKESSIHCFWGGFRNSFFTKFLAIRRVFYQGSSMELGVKKRNRWRYFRHGQSLVLPLELARPRGRATSIPRLRRGRYLLMVERTSQKLRHKSTMHGGGFEYLICEGDTTYDDDVG